jgi:hypothetical protein
MIDRSAFAELYTDHIEVTRSEGTRGPDGFTETSTSVVLDSAGNLQESGYALDQMAASFDKGAALFFCADSISGVQPSDTARITTADGRVIEATVEEIRPDDNSLLLSLQ